MVTHLIKLSVGPESVADLEEWQQGRLKQLKRARKKPELIHITRQTPKRAEELLAGGSIYWVIKGWISARQKILELRPVERDGINCCGIVLEHELIRVMPRPCRAFQGWRYFPDKDIPPDLVKNKLDDEISEEMLRELSELGLL